MLICYDALMRTTVDISDDALYVAKAFAAERRLSLGAAISELILSPSPAGLGALVVRESRSPYPSLRTEGVLTVERVKELLDEDA